MYQLHVSHFSSLDFERNLVWFCSVVQGDGPAQLLLIDQKLETVASGMSESTGSTESTVINASTVSTDSTTPSMPGMETSTESYTNTSSGTGIEIIITTSDITVQDLLTKTIYSTTENVRSCCSKCCLFFSHCSIRHWVKKKRKQLFNWKFGWKLIF